MADNKTPNSPRSRYVNQGQATVKKVRTGAAKAAGPSNGSSKGDTLTNELENWRNRGSSSTRSRSSVNEIIKMLCQEEGIFSSAAQAAVSISSNAGFRIAGYNGAGQMDLAVMQAAWSVVDMLDTYHDYSNGYNDKPGFNSVVTQLILDTVTSGGCGGELVLGDNYLPERIAPLAYSTVEWVADGKGGRYPSQKDNDAELNLPTIAISEHNRFPDEAYAYSMLRPGLNNSFAFTEFTEDLRRAVNRSGHSRMTASIDSEKVTESMPEAIRESEDPNDRINYMEQVRQAVETSLQGLEPEDAVVSFDSVTFEHLSADSAKSDYSPLLSTLGNLTGASLKTPASVTGLRAEGGQGLSNAETLVYLKVISGVPMPACEVLSRLVTLAIRLWGIDGYVKFEPKPINLRPELELEAWKSTQQKRVLEQLSHGIITDARACYEMGVRPEDWLIELSASGFYSAGAGGSESAERESSSGRSLAPGTPSQSGGDEQ